MWVDLANKFSHLEVALPSRALLQTFMNFEAKLCIYSIYIVSCLQSHPKGALRSVYDLSNINGKTDCDTKYTFEI